MRFTLPSSRSNGFAIALTLFSAALMAQPAPLTVKIQDATTVHLSLTQSLSSATNKVDDPVAFEVTEDVKVGDVITITARPMKDGCHRHTERVRGRRTRSGGRAPQAPGTRREAELRYR